VVLGLLLLALWRYMEQRFKATNQAYWSVIALTARDGKVTLDKSAPAASDPTHAGVSRSAPSAARRSICSSRPRTIRLNGCCRRATSKKADSTAKSAGT
jgi:hypothetical protein